MIMSDNDDLAANIESPEDKFLVCIFNVSVTVAHTIFHVCKSSTALDVIKLALERGRRNTEDPTNYILVEEIALTNPKKKGKSVHQRILSSDENIYLIQNSWKDFGKLTLLEKNKSLGPHLNIRETKSDPVSSPKL